MSIEVSGFDEAIQASIDMAARALDLSPVLDVIAEDLSTFVDDSFKDSRGPTGEKWEPLKPKTVKRRRNRSNKPLVDRGTLRASISAQVEKLSLFVGTNVVYAGTHQFGTTHVPARPFLPFTAEGPVLEGLAAEEWERYSRMILAYIETGEIIED